MVNEVAPAAAAADAGAPGNEIEITPEGRLELKPVEAIDALAKLLHWKMEHLDPSDDDDWNKLSEHKKDFFRLCVKAVIREKNLIASAMA